MLRFLALLVLLALHPAPEAIGARRPRPEPCNPDTDILNAFGGAELAPYEGGVQSAPAGVGTIAFAADAGGITATLTGSSLRPETHSVAIALVDAATGRPVFLDYGFTTARALAPDGTITSVRLPVTAGQVTGAVRAHVMVDAYPAATTTLTIPAL